MLRAFLRSAPALELATVSTLSASVALEWIWAFMSFIRFLARSSALINMTTTQTTSCTKNGYKMTMRECVGSDEQGNFYEIERNKDGEWDILKQGRYQITFNTRENALVLVRYIISQSREGLSA